MMAQRSWGLTTFSWCVSNVPTSAGREILILGRIDLKSHVLHLKSQANYFLYLHTLFKIVVNDAADVYI